MVDQVPQGAPFNDSFSEQVDFADVDLDGDADIVGSDRRGARRGVFWLERPSAWLSLDGGDNDLAHFLTYVIAALRQGVDGCLPKTEQMLAGRNLPSPGVLAESMVFELEDLERKVELVLDDYQVIPQRNLFSVGGGAVDPVNHTYLTAVNYVNDEPQAWFLA